MMVTEDLVWFEPAQLYKFYGVDTNRFKLDDRVYHAVEDEDDGYRSYLGSIEVEDSSDLIFMREPLAEVAVVPVRDQYSFDGYHLLDASGHVWLRIGTGDWDDYYPYFVFEYTPPQE